MLTRLIVSVAGLLVPRAERARWREEWLAELPHGGWRMLAGALPDAWTLRKIRQSPPASGGLRHPFGGIGQDVRYGLRTLATGKSFTLAVVGSLALGIGATTTAFALVNARLFRPIPEIEAQRELVLVTLGPRQRVWIQTSWEDHEILRDSLTALGGLAVSHDASFAVAAGGGSEPRMVSGLVVSGNYFGVLGVRPALGRFFVPDEDAVPWGQPAVVVSYAYWQQDLSGDRGVLKRTVTVNGVELPIVGVAPQGFGRVFTFGDPDVWITFALSNLVFRDGHGRPIHARAAPPFHATLIGRLNQGRTIEQVQAQAAALAPALAKLRDRGMKELFVRAEPLQIADAETYAALAMSLMVVPLIVLTIACVNAAMLLLARASRRSSDWMVRLTLGASRWRIVRQILVESTLLALAGGALGLVLCVWSASYVRTLIAGDVAVDARVLGFVLAGALATALVFGLGPALTVTRSSVRRAPGTARPSGGAFGSRTRAVLVAVQTGLCLALLATGAQFMKTLQTIWDEGLPEPGRFLTISLDLDPLRYTRDTAEAFYRELLARAQEVPGVEAAALTGRSAASMLGGWVMDWGPNVWVPGRTDRERGVLSTYATADLFATMGLTLVRGRTFTPDEHRGPSRVVIVNRKFADQTFGGDALGRVITLRTTPVEGDPDIFEAMVVGVFDAEARRALFHRLPNVIYPAPLGPAPSLELLLRFDGDAQGVAAAVRTIVSTLDSRLPVGSIFSGEELRRRRNQRDYTLAQIVSALGALSLVLAAAGLYGVVSYMVMLRQKEIGIRMAVGAESASVLRLIVRQSIVPVLAGCVLGSAAAVIAGQIVRSRLYGVSAMDPAAFGGATLLLLAVMTVASLAPARRASRVDPVQVLRTE
jgi:predicted permease